MGSPSLREDDRREIALRKATCPFIGPVVRTGELAVHGSPDRPLAAVSEVADLGDSGGGNLGSLVLKVFAIGNHSRVPDQAGRFETPTPDGFFSLDFPGSRGAHPGDSRILLADPLTLESGRISRDEFERLRACADERGRLTIEAVGGFIARNVERDPRSRRLEPGRVLKRLFDIFGEGVGALLALTGGRHAGKRSHVEFVESLTALAPEDNLIGSAGEFGLLFAFLANKPGAEEDAVSLADVEGMMLRLELPSGWRDWPKTAADWVEATGELTLAALRTTRALNDGRAPAGHPRPEDG